jgi:hypothetical protein
MARSLAWRDPAPVTTRLAARAASAPARTCSACAASLDVDHRLLLANLPAGGADRGIRLGVGGAGLREPCLPIGGIERDQRVAGVYELVVFHQDGGDVALDARAEYGNVALHIGVVGAFDVTPLGEPPARGDQHNADHHQKDQRAQPTLTAFARWRAGGRGVGGKGFRLVGNGVHAALGV